MFSSSSISHFLHCLRRNGNMNVSDAPKNTRSDFGEWRKLGCCHCDRFIWLFNGNAGRGGGIELETRIEEKWKERGREQSVMAKREIQFRISLNIQWRWMEWNGIRRPTNLSQEKAVQKSSIRIHTLRLLLQIVVYHPHLFVVAIVVVFTVDVSCPLQLH